MWLFTHVGPGGMQVAAAAVAMAASRWPTSPFPGFFPLHLAGPSLERQFWTYRQTQPLSVIPVLFMLGGESVL